MEKIDKFVQQKSQLLETISASEDARKKTLGDTTSEQLHVDKKEAQDERVKKERAIQNAEQKLAELKSQDTADQMDAIKKKVELEKVATDQLRKKIDEIEQLEDIVAEHTLGINKAEDELFRLLYTQNRYTRGDGGYFVEGGLVVPFYLIVLSLLGGAVSLTRRIPEYQKQSAPGYAGTEDAPVLTPAELREYLVFQIVQVISAPFIAAVAYYVLAPATTAAIVGLAFASGFASETVLLWVRGVVDKLRPDSTGEKQKGYLTGTVSSLIGSATAEDTKKGVTVSIIGQGELMPTYAPKGQFAINSIPEGEYALEVKLANKKVCTKRVHIQAGHTLPIWIECA